jgi:uncharacterized protein with HEPN domain
MVFEFHSPSLPSSFRPGKAFEAEAKGFRDIASHWYEEGLDHRLIWHAPANDLPPMLDSLQRWIDNQQSDSAP